MILDRFLYSAIFIFNTTISPLFIRFLNPLKLMLFFLGEKVFTISKSETKAPVILVISDFKIADVRESKQKNSSSKNLMEDNKL